jgi:hypothetical protein
VLRTLAQYHTHTLYCVYFSNYYALYYCHTAATLQACPGDLKRELLAHARALLLSLRPALDLRSRTSSELAYSHRSIFAAAAAHTHAAGWFAAFVNTCGESTGVCPTVCPTVECGGLQTRAVGPCLGFAASASLISVQWMYCAGPHWRDEHEHEQLLQQQQQQQGETDERYSFTSNTILT